MAKPTPDYRKMFQLAEHYSEASEILDKKAREKDWGSSAPRLLVDSFAAELYLKCLYVLDTGLRPLTKHDWDKLFDALSPHTKTAIRDAFDRIIKDDPVLRNIKVINPEAARVTDFNRSLLAARDTFYKRRYLYEAQPNGEWLCPIASGNDPFGDSNGYSLGRADSGKKG